MTLRPIAILTPPPPATGTAARNSERKLHADVLEIFLQDKNSLLHPRVITPPRSSVVLTPSTPATGTSARDDVQQLHADVLEIYLQDKKFFTPVPLRPMPL